MPQDPFDDIVKGYDQQFAPPKVRPVKPPKPPSFDDLVKDVDGQVGSASTPKAQRRQAIAGLQDELTQSSRQVKPGETRNLVTGQTYPTVTPKFQSPIDMRLNAPNEAQKAFDRAAAATGQQPAAPKPRNAFQAPRPKPMLERVMAQQAIERQQPQTVETDPQRMEQVRQATAQQLATQRQVRQVQAREDVAQMNPLQRMAVRGMAKVGGATNADLAETMPVSGVESTLGQFGQGAITTAARIPEGMERLGQSLPNVFDPFRANARLRESQRQAGQNTLLTSGITKAGDAFADTVAPIDKTDEGFLTAKLPRGLGSSVPFLASSALGGGMPAAAALGAAINAQQTGEDLDRMGVQDEATRQKATAVAGLIGTLEAFGVEGRLGKIFGGQGGVLKRLLGAGGEGLQEWTTEELNDINAKLIAAYDPNRSIDPFQRKQLEAAALGALTGGMFETAGGIAQAAQQRPITQARQAIDARSAANAAAIAPQAQPITEPLTEPLTAPVQAAPVAAGRSQDFRRRGAQLLGEEIEEAAPVAPVTPQAAPVVQPVAQPAPEPTVTGALRAEADAAKIEAGELEQAGDFANAVNAYDAAHKNLKLLRRRLGTPKTPEDVSLINQIDREISLAATNRQKAKEQARGMARQANRPTAGLPDRKLPDNKMSAPQPVASAPLLRPDAAQAPTQPSPPAVEASPAIDEPTGETIDLTPKPRRAPSAPKAKPAKRLVQRIKELGGIGIRHVGEMQGLKDARRVGILRNKPEMSPDVLAQQLRSEGYDVDPDDLNTLWAAIDRDIAGQERPANTAEINRRLAEDEAAWNEQQEARGTSQNFDQIVEEVDADFQPDTADLREVRAFGRKPQTEQFTEEPPTAPLAQRRERIRPPAPASPRGVGNRPMTVDVAGERTPVAMSADFPRARREMVRAGREVDARLEMGQEKGDFGNVAEAMFKSNTPDVLHGQDSFFHDPDVKGKLGLTRDAEMADVRRELKTQLAKSLNLSVDEISLSHIKPEVWRAWARQKGLGREAVRKLEAGIARAERKQRAVETNAQIVAEESQRAQADVRAAKAKPADLEKQIKDIQSLIGWTIDEAEAKRQIAALRARAAKDTKFDKMVTDEGRALRQEWGILKTFSASDMQGAVDNARVKTSADPANPRAGIIYINTNAKTVIDTIWEANGGSKFSAAIALDTPALESVADVLRYEASFLEGNDAKQVEALADAFSEMVSAKYDGAGLINVDLADYGYLDLARDHELFHVWQYGQSQPNNPTRTPMGVEWATKLPGYEKIRASLLEKGYSDDPEDLVREFAAYAATNDLERIGIAPNEAETVATEFLYEYFQQIAKQFGAQHLERIGRVSVPARSTIERVRDEIRTTQTAARTASQSRSNQPATRSPSRTAAAGIRLSDRTGTGGREGGETRVAARTSQEQGQPQRRTRESVENSPEFKRWFGDSKVVDENGKPLVVYHGTESDFDVFDEDKIRRPGYGFGFHFAESSGLAGAYSKQGYGANKNVMPVYLSIKNPFTGDYYQFAAEIGTNWPPEIAAELKKRGYDGIRYNHGEWSESKGQSPYAWVAFSPSQIKSATGNRGTFNPASPRINEMRLNLPQEQGFSVGRLRNEPQGQLAASGLGGFQNLFDRKPKAPKQPTQYALPKGWNADKWARKFYTDTMVAALPKDLRKQYDKADTQKQRNAIILNAPIDPKLEQEAFAFIDKVADATQKGDGGALYDLLADHRKFFVPPRTKAEKAKVAASDLLNLPRAIMASTDISAPLRQGAILTLPPTQWGKAAKASVRMFEAMIPDIRLFGKQVTQSHYRDIQKRINLHPDAETAKDAGLYLSTDETGLRQTEEDFLSNWTQHIPIVKQSEQAYKAYLDTLRMETFARYKKSIDKAKLTAEQKEDAYKAAADWINVASGRGSLGKTFDAALPALSKVFFAPRYAASRIQVLNPVTYAKNVTTPAGRAVLKGQMSDLVQFSGMIAATLALAAAAGAEVNDDPDDADFLKIKVGNVRYDVLAGLQQPMRLFYRMGEAAYTKLTGQKSSSRQDAVDIAARYGRSKLAPVPSFFVDALTGKTYPGEDFDAQKGVVDRVTPLMWRDFYEAYQKEGLGTAVKILPGAVGIGVQNYGERKGSLKESAFTKEAAERGKDYDFLRKRPGEPDAVYQKRVERVSGWMDEYGQKLLNHPRYQAMPEADQKAAIESLRRRIGAQQNLTRPKLSSLEPNAVLLGLQRSKAGKAKREREGKYLYTPQP